MKDNIARQQASYLAAHGTPMPPSTLTHTLSTCLALQALFFEDCPATTPSPCHSHLHKLSFWRSLCPTLTLCPGSLLPVPPSCPDLPSPPQPSAPCTLPTLGYTLGAPPTPATLALCAALRPALACLSKAGLPPIFLLIYDQAWELLASGWPHSLLGPCTMEADMYAWALCGSGIGGSSFGSSHRDQAYSACHDSAGCPTSLTVWLPFNAAGAGAHNGAMRVLPIPADDFFFSPAHPSHMRTAQSLASAREAAAEEGAGDPVHTLAAPAGQACLWSPALIHWGGAAAPGSSDPRCSLAATFRAAHAPPSCFGAEAAEAAAAAGEEGRALLPPPPGPPPIALASFGATLSLARRLAYVSKGLLAYSHWHPGMPGLDIAAP